MDIRLNRVNRAGMVLFKYDEGVFESSSIIERCLTILDELSRDSTVSIHSIMSLARCAFGAIYWLVCGRSYASVVNQVAARAVS